MNSLKTLLKTGAIAAVLAAGATVAATTAASADTVCNRDGECWHVSERYNTYPTVLGITFYGDDWAASHRNDRHYRWRDNQKDDHGYYERGTWHTFAEHH